MSCATKLCHDQLEGQIQRLRADPLGELKSEAAHCVTAACYRQTLAGTPSDTTDGHVITTRSLSAASLRNALAAGDPQKLAVSHKSCGTFSFFCDGVKSLINSNIQLVKKADGWVHRNSEILGYVELGLGIASMFTGLGVIADVAFIAGAALSVDTTVDSCVRGSALGCASGVAGLAYGGAGFKLGKVADRLFARSGSVGILRGAAFHAGGLLMRAASQYHNGMSVAATGAGLLSAGAFVSGTEDQDG